MTRYSCNNAERNYHLLKDEPLGISPLFVRKEDQIIGLTHLLTLEQIANQLMAYPQ